MGTHRATLITGASGFLGGLIAAAILAEEPRPLVLAFRNEGAAQSGVARIRDELLHLGLRPAEADKRLGLVRRTEMPPLDRMGELGRAADGAAVDEVIHCAGCVDYFDERRLQLGNVELTRSLVRAAQSWAVGRFIFLSTAYCGGYGAGIVREELHPDPAPADEPTSYTRSKRIAERTVAASGLPYVIVRPSIVIGDGRSGRYTGKNYGLYQMWRALEGLLCKEYYPVWHTVAPEVALDFVHQDSFQAAFVGIYRALAGDHIVHLVGRQQERPTMRELCSIWADIYAPVEIHCYDSVDSVPLDRIPRRQRLFLELAAKNFEISTHGWRFATDHMTRLRGGGLTFADTTLDSIIRCQTRFIDGSAPIREHRRRYAGRGGPAPRLIPCSTPQGAD